MPGTIMDALATLAGRPDPSMQLMAALGQAPGQPGGGPPVPGAPPPPGPAGGGAPPTQQGPPPAGPPGGPGGPSAPTMGNGQPAPNAYASPSDLSQMYLAMAQRAQASNQLNMGLGLLAASAYPGRRPDIIMNAMRGMNQDPTELFGNLVRLQQFGQQQQNYQAMRAAVPAMLEKAGIDQSFAPLVMADPSMLEKVVETQLGVGGGPAWMAQQRAEKALTAQGQPIPWTPGDPTSYDAWTKANATQKVAEAKDAQSDKDAFTAADGDYRQTEQLLGWLKAHPDATAAAVQNGAFAAGRLGQVRQWLGSLPGGLPADTATAAGYIQQLAGKLYSSAWSGRGGRLSQIEAGKISQGFSQLDNPAMPADQINQQIGDLYNKTLTSHANTYGAAGMPTPTPYYGYMDNQYKKGGKIDRGATELTETGTGSAAGPPSALGSSSAASAPPAAPAAGGGAQAAPAGAGNDFRGMNDADVEKAVAGLPSGASFIGPDGKRYTKR